MATPQFSNTGNHSPRTNQPLSGALGGDKGVASKDYSHALYLWFLLLAKCLYRVWSAWASKCIALSRLFSLISATSPFMNLWEKVLSLLSIGICRCLTRSDPAFLQRLTGPTPFMNDALTPHALDAYKSPERWRYHYHFINFIIIIIIIFIVLDIGFVKFSRAFVRKRK